MVLDRRAQYWGECNDWMQWQLYMNTKHNFHGKTSFVMILDNMHNWCEKTNNPQHVAKNWIELCAHTMCGGNIEQFQCWKCVCMPSMPWHNTCSPEHSKTKNMNPFDCKQSQSPAKNAVLVNCKQRLDVHKSQKNTHHGCMPKLNQQTGLTSWMCTLHAL